MKLVLLVSYVLLASGMLVGLAHIQHHRAASAKIKWVDGGRW